MRQEVVGLHNARTAGTRSPDKQAREVEDANSAGTTLQGLRINQVLQEAFSGSIGSSASGECQTMACAIPWRIAACIKSLAGKSVL